MQSNKRRLEAALEAHSNSHGILLPSNSSKRVLPDVFPNNNPVITIVDNKAKTQKI